MLYVETFDMVNHKPIYSNLTLSISGAQLSVLDSIYGTVLCKKNNHQMVNNDPNKESHVGLYSTEVATWYRKLNE